MPDKPLIPKGLWYSGGDVVDGDDGVIGVYIIEQEDGGGSGVYIIAQEDGESEKENHRTIQEVDINTPN